MKFEHVAFNVPDSRAHARWLADALGFTIARAPVGPTHMHFLADETGRIVLELYTNPDHPFLDFKAQHPMVTHFALVSTDAGADRARLEKAGATTVSDDSLPDGTRLVIVKDPWGFALQLCQRAVPFPMP
ncbi:MAG: VOC family protein [Verrucomicrobia bacterium]|nr:VOC family protein [Verrucomicrobiota bacterium]